MDVERILDEFINFISVFEKKMKIRYNIPDFQNSWCVRNVFDRKGTIDEYCYQYHGAGCRLEVNDVICEYNVAPLNGKDIKFSLWGFNEFINTHSDYKSLGYSSDYIKNELGKLIDNNVLSWVEMEGHVFEQYQVN